MAGAAGDIEGTGPDGAPATRPDRGGLVAGRARGAGVRAVEREPGFPMIEREIAPRALSMAAGARAASGGAGELARVLVLVAIGAGRGLHAELDAPGRGFRPRRTMARDARDREVRSAKREPCALVLGDPVARRREPLDRMACLARAAARALRQLAAVNVGVTIGAGSEGELLLEIPARVTRGARHLPVEA